ncbi:COG3014 family protein [Pseudobacteriovorax antillogorgiicola]|uniref:Tetratricopeptide repeat-containing protein n=1 Tax=Pseudobacteriovorax antillogorgiicola TaxID=1513793 RepID=A0A1Y6CQ26_9BACT|nr:hypothetical protein [Pseudobacteriovorax antillogorgiicola]TCS42250.1 hypothetical protein EDD56_14221 [Pseudobacteriovorax antillogorgiicola]SMF82595.1 hypothetical protein SAMN06296036_14221 [Pseudobacteriovorax antillogorgiicola]
MTHLKGILRGAFFLVLMLAITQCSSYTDDTKEIRQDFRTGRYQKALEGLEKSSVKNSSRNRLLYLLEKASILEKLGEHRESRALLIEADKVVDELYTVSVSKEAATYLFNESAQDYPGEDYEKVAIHTMMALSFLSTGELDKARVEARRINTRLNEINSNYDKKNRYSEDAFGRYLAGMIYEARGEWDSAIIDYRKALETYEGTYESLFKTDAPRSLVESLYALYLQRNRRSEANAMRKKYRWLSSSRPSNAGELIVIHQLGDIAVKRRSEFVVPVGKQIVRFSFPIIRPKPNYFFGKTGLDVDGRPFERAELSQNMDLIASHTLEDRRLRLMVKAAARLILKGQMTQKAEKEGGPLVGLLFNIYGAVSETADTRQWSLLPSSFHVSRLRLRPGEHKVKIYSDGKLSSIESVNVKPGEIKFIVDQK